MTSSNGRSAILATTALTLGVFAAGTAFADAIAINGEGSSLAAPTYQAEFVNENAFDTHYALTDYSSSSGKGQTAFANGVGVTPPTGVPSGVVVDFAASDSYLTSAYVSSYAASALAAADGPLIQIPMMGTPITVAVQNSLITANGSYKLADSEVCGVFSGKLTKWNQTYAGKLLGLTGTFNLVYRSDNSGTTFLLTQHLAKVCTTANSNFSFTGPTALVATQSFSSLFTTIPANFIGESGSAAVATELESLTSGIGYLSPDFTSIAPNGNSAHHTLFVASLKSPNGSYYAPTVTNTSLALSSTDPNGLNRTPPATKAAALVPTNWVPALPTPSAGYPIVGYTNWIVSNCYQSGKGAGVTEFINRHLNPSSTLRPIITNNGFLPLTNTAYLNAIKADLTGNSSGYNISVGNAIACAGKTGR